MFGGKTEYIIARLRQEQASGRRVRAFKHAMDGRYAPDHLVTHRQDRFAAYRADSAADIARQSGDVDVVAIDEGQFFRPALTEVVEELLARGLTVIIAGISHDAWGRPFEPMPQLVARADQAVLRQAPCVVCGAPAAYTQRMTAIGSLLMVGGAGDYEPRCGEHFTPLPGPPEGR